MTLFEIVLLTCNILPLLIILNKEWMQEIEIKQIERSLDDIQQDMKDIKRTMESIHKRECDR